MSNKMYRGTQEVKAVYRGFSPVKAIYKGNTLLWQSGVKSGWLEPIQTGVDLYIRSVLNAKQEGDKLRITAPTWVEPVQTGTDLYSVMAYKVTQSGSDLTIE